MLESQNILTFDVVNGNRLLPKIIKSVFFQNLQMIKVKEDAKQKNILQEFFFYFWQDTDGSDVPSIFIFLPYHNTNMYIFILKIRATQYFLLLSSYDFSIMPNLKCFWDD